MIDSGAPPIQKTPSGNMAVMTAHFTHECHSARLPKNISLSWCYLWFARPLWALLKKNIGHVTSLPKTRITIYVFPVEATMSNTAFKVPAGTGYMPWRVVVSTSAGPNPLPPPFNAPRSFEPADPNGVDPLEPVTKVEMLDYEADGTKPAVLRRVR